MIILTTWHGGSRTPANRHARLPVSWLVAERAQRSVGTTVEFRIICNQQLHWFGEMLFIRSIFWKGARVELQVGDLTGSHLLCNDGDDGDKKKYEGMKGMNSPSQLFQLQSNDTFAVVVVIVWEAAEATRSIKITIPCFIHKHQRSLEKRDFIVAWLNARQCGHSDGDVTGTSRITNTLPPVDSSAGSPLNLHQVSFGFRILGRMKGVFGSAVYVER